MARDNAMLEERGRILETLETLLDAVNHASTEQRAAIDALVAASADLLDRVGTRFTDKVDAEAGKMADVAAQITGSAVEVASLGEAFGFAVQLFSQSNDKLVAHLQRIEGALGKSIARSDEQLAYYVAQAREVIDLSIMSQKQIVEDLQQLASQPGTRGQRSVMTEDVDAGLEPTVPVWAVFGDLMSGLLGAFVLILVCVLGMQLDLATKLEAEVRQRQAEAQRLQALEQALAGPLAAGRVTLNNGRIGISGSVLFAFNSAELQPEGRQLLKSLAAPLAAYLQARDEILMVSGFTDDRQVRGRQPPVRRQLGAVGPAGLDGDPGADRGRHPVGLGVCRGLRFRAGGGVECRCRGTVQEPARGDGADAEAVQRKHEVRVSSEEAMRQPSPRRSTHGASAATIASIRSAFASSRRWPGARPRTAAMRGASWTTGWPSCSRRMARISKGPRARTAPRSRTAGHRHRGALAELVDHIAPACVAPSATAELKTLGYFRSTWSRLSAERRLTQSLATVPENAGPLNSHHLVHRSLMLMRELSPEYLHRFMSYVDALLWVDRVNGGNALAASDSPRAENHRKKSSTRY